jgi:hypothetical protein
LSGKDDRLRSATSALNRNRPPPGCSLIARKSYDLREALYVLSGRSPICRSISPGVVDALVD